MIYPLFYKIVGVHCWPPWGVIRFFPSFPHTCKVGAVCSGACHEMDPAIYGIVRLHVQVHPGLRRQEPQVGVAGGSGLVVDVHAGPPQPAELSARALQGFRV